MANVTLQASPASASDLSEYVFGAIDIGAAASDRYIIVGVCLEKSDPADDYSGTTVTIGGVSATNIAFIQVASQRPVTFLAIANVPTGLTAGVTVTVGGAATSRLCGLGVWRTTGISPTPTDSGTSSAADPTNTITVNAGGIVVGIVFSATPSAATSVTWTGLTEGYDASIDVNNSEHSGASLDSSSTQDVTVTADFSDNTGIETGSFASFPALATFKTKVIVM